MGLELLNETASVGPVRPFRIDVAEETLVDLKRRLSGARRIGFPLTEPELGISIPVLEGLLDHCRDEFDWRWIEAQLNRFKHVLVEVDGMDVHAVRARGQGPKPLPVIVGHGWPSTFAEALPAVGPIDASRRFWRRHGGCV
jgi:hypothetical protein